MSVEKGAVLSADGLYRYRLWRRWGVGRSMAWIMLNPSTADAEVDDPTIRRCMSFARREGFDGIEVVNLFGARATRPTDLFLWVDPEGRPDNWRYCEGVFRDPGIGMLVAAWGASRVRRSLPSSVYDNLPGGLFCLWTTADGSPRHPLYVKGNTEFRPWRR